MDYKISLVLCVATLANLCLAQEASISYISPPQTKNPGENATFNCTVVKPNDVPVTWLKDGRTLTLGKFLAFNDQRLNIEVDEQTNTFKLTIQNLTTTDSGKYRCQINLYLQRTVGKDVDLQVTRPPIIVDTENTNFLAVEGQTVVLPCKADGYPRPEITWKRDNRDLMSNKQFEFKGANLTIIQVKKEDRGRYICEASNNIGNSVTKNVLLEVNFGPTISSKRPKVGQKVGYSAKLICRSVSYPPSSISFVHNNKELNNNEHHQILNVGIGNGETEATLTFHDVRKHNFGHYECKAKNSYGNAETKVELFEQEIPNETFSMLMQSSGHRYIGFHHFTAAIGTIIISFKLFY